MRRWTHRPEGSNWGDFGDDDLIGRMNLLTPERRLEAARTVEHGISFCLSLPLDYPGGSELVGSRKPPQIMAPTRVTGERSYNFRFENIDPAFTDIVADEAVTIYTQYSTQWDGLGHMGSVFDIHGNGKPEAVYYNGWGAGTDVVGPNPDGSVFAHKGAVDVLAVNGLQGRGVLVDLATHCGQEQVGVGYDLLMRLMDEQKVEVKEGDFLCIYTGFADLLLTYDRNPPPGTGGKCAVLDGRDPKLLDWITKSGIVAICADNLGVEALSTKSCGDHKHAMMPLHEHCLFKLGIHLGELWFMSELATWLRDHDRSSFLLTAPPLRLPGCVGSPVTPVALV